MSEFYKSLYGFALCILGGVSGAIAAVFGKLAGVEHLEQAAVYTCFVLLIVVSLSHV